MADLFKNPWLLIGIIAVLLIGGAVWYSNAITNSSNDGVEVRAHVKGNAESAITLVEYSDFQCPACAQFAPIVDALVTEYGDQLRFEYKHFPLIQIHPNAEMAARAAEAAGQQGKFFEYHDMLFAKQAEWSGASIPGAFFVKYAKELGLDAEQFTRQQRSSLLQQKVRDDLSEARTLSLTGTPTFFLNGQKMTFETFQDFRAQIEAALGIEVEVTPDPVVEFGV